MVTEKRDTGIKALGTLPWGSHICLFYGSRQDLVSILVPYFKSGLQNNEYCLWIIYSRQVGMKEAMREGGLDFSRYLETGQLEFLPYSMVYLKDGVFNMQKAMNTLTDMYRQALDKGYEGMRVAGYFPWRSNDDWRHLIEYESRVNSIFHDNNIVGLCAYPLDKCNAGEFVDAISTHPYAFIVQEGELIALRRKTAREAALPPVSKRHPPVTPLMEKFAVSGLKDFSDKETIELLLSLCLDHKRKLTLSRIISKFKTVRGILSASPQELRKMGLDSRCIQYFRLFREIPVRILEDKVKNKPIYDSPQDIFDYLYYSMRDLKKEVFKAIYLNAGNQIIGVADLFEGETDRIAVNTREVIQDAIASRAESLVFVHNHPSGDPAPSKADKQLTRDLVFVGNILQIRVLDHIIIGDNAYFSFAREKLIQEYETDFLNLKLMGTAEARRRLSDVRSSHKNS